MNSKYSQLLNARNYTFLIDAIIAPKNDLYISRDNNRSVHSGDDYRILMVRGVSCINLIILLSMIQFLSCDNPSEIQLRYEPPVTFTGFINGDEVTLTGNYYWQNSCTLIGDTIRMYFYSKSFSESKKIRNGDLMRIDFYSASDSILGIKNILFHLARYYEGNSSYTISPKDTLVSEKKVQMKRISLSAVSGHRVSLEEIYLRTGTVGITSGERLEIKNGVIEGVVE